MAVCSHTPRFSYAGPKTRVRAVSVHASDVRGRGAVAGYGTGWVVPGGYTGWVIQGYTDLPSQLLGETYRQRSGPRKALAGPGVGGLEVGRARGRRACSQTTPAGLGRAR